MCIYEIMYIYINRLKIMLIVVNFLIWKKYNMFERMKLNMLKIVYLIILKKCNFGFYGYNCGWKCYYKSYGVKNNIIVMLGGVYYLVIIFFS